MNMMQVIQGAAQVNKPVQHKDCPWCGSDVPLARQVNGIFLVGCESEDCAANPQVSGRTVVEAYAKWDARA